jgi:hypothetical protein
MKCVCGYVEPKETREEVQVLFQSGKRKGEVKRVDEVVTAPRLEDKFIEVSVEKGFTFTKLINCQWSSRTEAVHCSLYACPRCGTIKLDSEEDYT